MGVTVPTEQRSIDYAGNGATLTFPVPFEFREDEHLVVSKVLISSGVSTLQTLGVDYTCNGAGEQDGEVVFTVAPSALYTVHIERTVPITQDADFALAGSFDPGAHTRAFNHGTEVDQQLADRIGALEALGSLVPIGSFEGLVRQKTFTTDADAVEDTPAITVALSPGFIPTAVWVVKAENLDDPTAPFLEAVTAPSWSAAALLLTIPFITGLSPGVEYRITLMMVSTAVT